MSSPFFPVPDAFLIDKADKNKVTTSVQLVHNVEAPVEKGQKLGTMTVCVNGATRETIPLVACDSVQRLTVPASSAGSWSFY
jgi:hypothetical protein